MDNDDANDDNVYFDNDDVYDDNDDVYDDNDDVYDPGVATAFASGRLSSGLRTAH